MEIKVTLDKGNADVILLIRDNVLEAFDYGGKSAVVVIR